MHSHLYPILSSTEFHVGTECGFFEFFSMGWGIVHLHYVITACAAACLLQEKVAALPGRHALAWGWTEKRT